jgi:hypothetical protein
LEALKGHYGPNEEVELIIKDLDDEQMLKIMARENMEEWGHSAAVEHETVRATIEAYADGRVQLRKPKDINTKQTWYAPSFRVGFLGEVITTPESNGGKRVATKDKPYNSTTLGEFLGWQDASRRPLDRIDDALSALAYIEEGILKESDFDGLSRSQSRAVIRQAELARAATEGHARAADERRAKAEGDLKAARKAEAKAKEDHERDAAKREAERAEFVIKEEQRRADKQRQVGRKRAIKTGQHVAEQLRGGKRGTKDVAEIAAEVQDWPQEEQAPPDIGRYANDLAKRTGKTLDRVEPRYDELIKWVDYIPAESVGYLVAGLDKIIAKANGYRQLFAQHDQGNFIEGEVVSESELQAVGS